MTVLDAAYHELALTNSKLRAEIDRLRAALQQIADNEYSGYGGIGGIARKALEPRS